MKRVRTTPLAVALACVVAVGAATASPTAAAAAGVQATNVQSVASHNGTRSGGVVVSVSGTAINVTSRNNTTKAIQTTASTTFTSDGAASNLSAIAAGQYLHATGTTDASGVFTATLVAVSTTAPQGRGPGRADGTRSGGVVASVSGTTITVTGRNNTTKTIETTASTTFTLDGAASNLSAIAAGQYLHATGTTDASGVFTATSVAVSTMAPQGRGPGRADGTRSGGVVASVSGTTINVTSRNNTTKAIQTTASTTFTLDGAASSLSAIATGQHLHATGTTDASGVFTATSVAASTMAPQGRGQRP